MSVAPAPPPRPSPRARSPRGRRPRPLVSLGLALLALALALWLLYAFFPRRADPEVVLALPAPAAGIGRLEPIRVWPDMPLGVTGREVTDRSRIELMLAGQRLRVVVTRDTGSFRTEVRVPRRLRPGTYAFVARDLGSGREAARSQVRVEDGSRPSVVVQPARAQPGERVALTGGGFRGARRITVAVVAVDAPPRPLARIRTARNGTLVGVVAVPDDLAEGRHEVAALGPDRQPLGERGSLEVTR